MSGKMYEKRPEEDARYHDTWRLLKKYRDVTWSLELSIRQVKNQFRIDYDCSIEDFLESIYMAGADLGGTDIENHARCMLDLNSRKAAFEEKAPDDILTEAIDIIRAIIETG